MATSNKPPFHTYENAGFEDHTYKNVGLINGSNGDQTGDGSPYQTASITGNPILNSLSPTSSPSKALKSVSIVNPVSVAANGSGLTTANKAVNNNATTEMPFTDPMLKSNYQDCSSLPVTAMVAPASIAFVNTASSSTSSSSSSASSSSAKILSTTDSSGTTRLTSETVPGQALVTNLVSLQAQSPMDSFKEWSLNTFKCTKQLINEKRGIYSITNDAQLEADIEILKDNRNKLTQVLRAVQQLNNHYIAIVKTQRNLYVLMNEMSIKYSTSFCNNNADNQPKSKSSSKSSGNRHIVANFSCLSNNLSSSTFTSCPNSNSNQQSNHQAPDRLDDFLPILNHIKSSNLNLGEDFKKNAISLNTSIKNGEKLITALTFFCSNLSTLINKTVEDTMITVKNLNSARLEYDAERNSIYSTSSMQKQSSINYHNDRLELARSRYEHLRQDVQIKMRFLEENTAKVMHKQLALFHSAFASYSSGNTGALDATLKQFSIR